MTHFGKSDSVRTIVEGLDENIPIVLIDTAGIGDWNFKRTRIVVIAFNRPNASQLLETLNRIDDCVVIFHDILAFATDIDPRCRYTQIKELAEALRLIACNNNLTLITAVQ